MSGKKTMRTFTDEARLISRSLSEIREAMEDETVRVRRAHSPQISDKPFSLTTAVNAVIVGYLRLSEAERDRIVVDGAAALAGLVERETPDHEMFRHVTRAGAGPGPASGAVLETHVPIYGDDGSPGAKPKAAGTGGQRKRKK